MNITVWRITSQKHARSAFTGEGARLYGGRWNTPGTPLIYTAQSQSLAVLEVLVHLDSPALLNTFVFFAVEIDSSYVTELDLSALPKDWKDDPIPVAVQAIGDAWARKADSAVLRVPSTLVPGESNFLLNPRHSDFQRLKIHKPISFRFDPRLR